MHQQNSDSEHINSPLALCYLSCYRAIIWQQSRCFLRHLRIWCLCPQYWIWINDFTYFVYSGDLVKLCFVGVHILVEYLFPWISIPGHRMNLQLRRQCWDWVVWYWCLTYSILSCSCMQTLQSQTWPSYEIQINQKWLANNFDLRFNSKSFLPLENVHPGVCWFHKTGNPDCVGDL